MYTIEQLKMFVSAVELGSFSASARKLGKVQSAVSQAIGNLEIDFNIILFDRSTRKPTLTKDGERLYRKAKAIILQTEDLNLTAKSIANKEEALIKIALDDSFLTANFSHILNAFTSRFPATEIEIISAVSTNIVNLVTAKKADLGLIISQLDYYPNLEQYFIGNTAFIAVCNSKHPLASQTKVNEMALLLHPQFMLKGDDGKSLDQSPIKTSKMLWVNSFNTMKHLLLTSQLGWAFMPYHLVKNEIATKDLIKIDVTFDHKKWCPPTELLISKSISKGPAVSWMLESLKDLIK